MYMNLQELSTIYSADAETFALRIHQLQQQLRRETDPDTAFQLRSRIAQLEPLLRQSRALARVTRHYYDRGDSRNETYRL